MGLSSTGHMHGEFVTANSELLITGENTLLTARSITLVLDNPTSTGVAYPIQNGSLYTDERNVSTIYQDNPWARWSSARSISRTVWRREHYTFNVSQTDPPGTDTVTIVNGHFKESNITTQ